MTESTIDKSLSFKARVAGFTWLVTFITGAALCFGSAALAQQNPEELKQRILSQARSISEDDYAFTRTSRVEQTANGKTEQKVTVEKFDPRNQRKQGGRSSRLTVRRLRPTR